MEIPTSLLVGFLCNPLSPGGFHWCESSELASYPMRVSVDNLSWTDGSGWSFNVMLYHPTRTKYSSILNLGIQLTGGWVPYQPISLHRRFLPTSNHQSHHFETLQWPRNVSLPLRYPLLPLVPSTPFPSPRSRFAYREIPQHLRASHLNGSDRLLPHHDPPSHVAAPVDAQVRPRRAQAGAVFGEEAGREIN